MVEAHSILHKTIKEGQNTCQVMEDSKKELAKKSKMKDQGERTEHFLSTICIKGKS
jgi:hypothetical protein